MWHAIRALPTASRLTEHDLFALDSYSGPEFSRLNEALRAGRLDQLTRDKVEALRAALTKLPDYTGTVYRGTELPPAVLARYRLGNVIEETAFLSTSTKNGTFTGAVRFRIASKHGKQIGEYSRRPGENEVLFAPGSRFEVVKRKYNQLTATTSIHLTQI
ncbi:ADP-ribosyltransferase domain-containing protein [Nocardia sp. CC227C]|uniref:ADP-ribosyltransferase domain-containing protein n=1 Tax=Nocardia sp. CC227C TaxID=3044562 RepID=UPI00278BBCD8|nr:ADP-ribosyltransferase domain-containing protein [Nocardia sp. CC227C]